MSTKISRLNLKGDYKNNSNHKAMYQEYGWCYDNYINKGLTMKEMAKIAGVEVRTIQKWCNEKHKLNGRTFKEYAVLNNLQKDLIIGSLLGDGHIDKRQTRPNFIVSHAENQKDYLYWKYDILKNLCCSAPTRYDPRHKSFHGKDYSCQAFYRFNTRIIDKLIPYREMDISQLIYLLNNLSFSVFILDDAFRGSANWSLCVAKFSESDKKLFCDICFGKFGLNCWVQKDNRYVVFDSDSSRKIDLIILESLPQDLDIVQYKIIKKHTTKRINYLYINNGNDKIGLSTYCRETGWKKYKKIKQYMELHNINELSVSELDSLLKAG